MRNIFHIARKLVAVLLLGITVAGCAYTRYGIEISNVPHIREIYIRNAGTTNWGANIASDIRNIDKSKFSEMVDIRVIDANGVVYGKYNVPFNDAAFVETGKTRRMNPFLWIPIGLAGLALSFGVIIPNLLKETAN